MLPRQFAKSRRSSKSLLLVALLGASLSGCMSGAERRQVNLQEDTNTCEDFGSSYGSRAYNDCMLAQQRRRDVKQLESLEQARITSELALNGQIMAERARKDRCRRNPDRRECGR
jgi:hypothetical protein